MGKGAASPESGDRRPNVFGAIARDGGAALNPADTGMLVVITAADSASAWEIRASEFCLTMAETPTMPAKIKLAMLGSPRGPTAKPLRGDARRLHVASSRTLLLDDAASLLMIPRNSRGVGNSLSSILFAAGRSHSI